MKNQENKKQICILTLGCPKNIVDSEFIMSSLDKQKFIFTEIVENADIILLNTCGFLQSSIAESFSYMQALQNYKSKKPNLQLIVFGCLVSRFENHSKYSDNSGNNNSNNSNSNNNNSEIIELNKKFPWIDKFFPVFSVAQIADFLNLNYSISNSNYSKNRTDLLASKYYAYLKISDGCNRECAFCTIPNIKGKYKSQPQNDLLEDAKTLVNNGVKELILIGQETTNYGNDFNMNEKTNFYNLLSELSEIKQLQWIRIMYAHPNSFDDRILDLMNERKNICKYIDIPLQHISNNVLQAMKRGTPNNKIKSLIEKMRKIVPEIRIRSTFIVGFPNETEKDFQELYNFLNEFKLDRVGIFKYSAEIGTVGFENKNQINDEIKEERFAKLMELQQAISFEKNKKLVGQKLNILVEADFDEKFFAGRTEFDAPEIDNGVLVRKTAKNKKAGKLKLGEIQEFSVIDCSEYDLICE